MNYLIFAIIIFLFLYILYTINKISNSILNSDWKPIESCPKDGSCFLAVVPGYIPCVVHFKNNEYCETDDIFGFTLEQWKLTHWMSLPKSPKKD